MSLIQTNDPGRIFNRQQLEGRPDLLQLGRDVVEHIDQRITTTRDNDWKPGERPKQSGHSGMLVDYNPKPGVVDAQYRDAEKVDTSVHLAYDPATGAASEFHQTVSRDHSRGESFLMQMEPGGVQTYEYSRPDGKGLRVVLDAKRDVLAIMEGEVKPYVGPGDVPADSTPLSRESLASQLASFQLPIDSDLHHAYRNQSWFIPVMEGFMQKLGRDLGAHGEISPQGLLLQTQLTLSQFGDGKEFGSPPKELNLFGGIKNVQAQLDQQLFPLMKHVAPAGFAESFREAYCDLRFGK